VAAEIIRTGICRLWTFSQSLGDIDPKGWGGVVLEEADGKK
jgi:hypothetical protein